MNEQHTLQQFRETGRYWPDLNDHPALKGQDITGPGMVYLDGYYIEHWLPLATPVMPPEGRPRWLLTIYNEQHDGHLADMEEILYDFAMREGGPNRPGPQPEDTLPHVVVFGNPIAGFKLHGPFTNKVAADKHAEWLGEGGEWVMPIHPARTQAPYNLYPWDKETV